ncbi:MAG: hypothetical protein FJW39_09460 [Acidobacteria bacterium]|nr:hypothetical protein [Acidobacteriota bacterium]
MRRAAILLAMSWCAAAADWSLFRSGPVEVWTNTDYKHARQVMAVFDQAAHWTAKVLGRSELQPLWPVRITVFKNDKQSAQYRIPTLELRGDLYTAGLAAGEPVPQDWIRAWVRILLNDGTPVMGRALEEGLAEVVSTIEVKGPLITIGTPPAPARRTRDWARMHLLAVDPENTGRVRVFFSNLQQASTYEAAYKNAFGKREAEMEAALTAFIQAGQFNPQTVSGKPISLERDYRPRPQPTGPEAPPEQSAHEWMAKALAEKDPGKTKESLRKAMEINPRWAEPHFRFGALMQTPGGRVAPLKKACELEPRNIGYWKALAQAQVDAKDFAAALLSWRSAERAGADPEERARIETLRREYEQQRLELEAAERRRQEEIRQKELEQLKAESEARIREAEARANARLGKFESAEKPVEWWDGPQAKASVEGTLERVDCVKGPHTLHVRAAGKLGAYRLGDPSKITIVGGEASFACGPQKPARKIRVGFNPNGAINEIVALEFLSGR